MEWAQFLDSVFSPKDIKYQAREYVYAICTSCKRTNRVLLQNLKKQVKKRGTHLCWSCASQQAKQVSEQTTQQRVKEKQEALKIKIFNQDYTVRSSMLYGCLGCEKECSTLVGNFISNKFKGLCRSCSMSITKNSEKTTKNLNLYLKNHGYSPLTGSFQTRDKIELPCKDCGLSVCKEVNILLRNVESPPHCRSCGGKRSSTLSSQTKYKETMLSRYGVENPGHSSEIRQKAWDTLKENGGVKRSKGELELQAFIRTCYNGLLESSSTVLGNGLELDIYLPEKKLAFEFNGLYWHSEKFRKKTYHKEKREACEKLGIRLIQIQGDEWKCKKNLIFSLIKVLLGQITNKIHARKCVVKTVSSQEAFEFLEENHLMGSYKAAKHLGLFFKNELVSLLSYRKYKDGWDISRFCSKKETLVVGGLGKLLNALPPAKFIQSFVDLRYGTGKSLYLNGFTLKNISLGWRWTDTNKTFNRLQCRANMDARGLSEQEHAGEKGWLKLYDAGQALFIKGG